MIESPRLIFRTLTAHDAELILAGTGPAGLTFVGDYPSAFATQVLRLVALYPSIDQQVGKGVPDRGPWLLLRRVDRAVIGTVSAARTGSPSEVCVGYDIARSCQDEGYASEALSAVIKHLLVLPDVRRVCAETVTEHVASRRVLEQVGMHWRREERAKQGGRELRLAHYAIDRPASV